MKNGCTINAITEVINKELKSMYEKELILFEGMLPELKAKKDPRVKQCEERIASTKAAITKLDTK